VEMLREWEWVLRDVGSGEWDRARKMLAGMEKRIDEWVGRGGGTVVGDAEVEGMRVDVMRLQEKVLTMILQKRGHIADTIRVPEPAITRHANPPRKAISRSYAPSRVASSTTTSSSSDYSSRISTKSLRQTKSEFQNLQQLHPAPPPLRRKESEKLVDEAIRRASPVTLFTPPTHKPPAKDHHLTSPPRRHTRETPPQSPDTPTPTVALTSRDVTPTPADPHGLRYSTASQLTTPRKKAALYTTPRWPTSGRPSPSPSPPAEGTPTPSQKPRRTHKGRRGFGVAAQDDAESIISSIYDEIEEVKMGSAGGEKGREEKEDADGEDGDGDPAKRIWRGIDEEYYSPEGGRFHRRRRARRQVSVRGAEERVLL